MRLRLVVATALLLLTITFARDAKRVDLSSLRAKPPIGHVEALNAALPLMSGSKGLKKSSKADLLFVSATASYLVGATGDEVIEFYREIGARRGWSVLTGRKYGGVRDLDMCGGECSYQVSYVPISMLVRVVVRTTWTMDKWSTEYCRPQEIAPAFRVASPRHRISGNAISAHNSSAISHRSSPAP